MNEYLKINEEYIAFCKTLFYFNIFFFLSQRFHFKNTHEISYIYNKSVYFLV